MKLGNTNLDPLGSYDLTRYCTGQTPQAGQAYEFRVRASYIWNAGATNYRNGHWANSAVLTHNLAG